jgi:serine/threonine-protein kinase
MEQPDTLIGATLSGRFKVETFGEEEVLGRVYSALDLKDQVRVRIKVLHPFLEGNAEKTTRFERELRAATRVVHPNVLSARGGGRHGKQLYMVLEDFEGTPLSAMLGPVPLPAARAASLLAQVARGLGAAHAAGIVHRNLSLQNVLVSPNDEVKIRDFGLCRFNEEETDSGPNEELTSQAARIGHIAYMAPEYIEGWRIEPSGDVYALGALLFHALVGRPPYGGKAAAVLEGHLFSPVPRPSLIRADVPRWTDALIELLMAKDPANRPANGEDAAAWIEAAIPRPPAPPRRIALTPSSAAIGVAVVLGVAFAIGAWWLFK